MGTLLLVWGRYFKCGDVTFSVDVTFSKRTLSVRTLLLV